MSSPAATKLDVRRCECCSRLRHHPGVTAAFPNSSVPQCCLTCQQESDGWGTALGD